MPRIVLDPAHGGHQVRGRSTPTGHVGPGGSVEKDVTLGLCHLVSEVLPSGAELTRGGDYNMALGSRIDRARHLGADVFVSVHSGPRSTDRAGPVVWVHSDADARSRDLARVLAWSLDRDEGGVPVYACQLAVLAPDRHDPSTAACAVDVGDLGQAHVERWLVQGAGLSDLAVSLAEGLEAYVRRGRVRRLGGGSVPRAVRYGNGAEKCAPDYWFLTQIENDHEHEQASLLTDIGSRSSTWQIRYGIAATPYTSNNLVRPLIDGSDYFADLQYRMESLVAGDALYAVGWQFTRATTLLRGDEARRPNPDESEHAPLMVDTPDLEHTIDGVCRAKVDVRFLVFKEAVALGKLFSKLAPWADHVPFVANINKAGGQAMLDSLLPPTGMASHHQKAVLTRRDGSWTAYVGGVDLAVDRWDTGAHDKPGLEKGGTFIAWHDIQLRVQGDACAHVWANMADRWNAHWAVAPKPKPPLTEIPDSGAPKLGTKPGTHHVQVLRTVPLSPKYDAAGHPIPQKPLYDFSPRGESTLLEGLLHAISKAEHYIYIEDQFLYDCYLAPAIAERMAVAPNLQVILVLAEESEFPPPVKSYNYYLRDQFLEKITRGKAYGAASRVYPYGLYRTDGKAIYVHSKLFLVDDRYAVVGSGNVNQRSLTADMEMNLAVVDAKLVTSPLGGSAQSVCTFARDLRRALWAEHLGRTPSDDPIHSLQTQWPSDWTAAAKAQVGHLRCLTRNPGKKNIVDDAIGATSWLDPTRHRIL